MTKKEMKMNNKKFLIGVFILIGIFSIMSFVLGANAATINFPVAVANISGSTYTLGVTLDTNAQNMSNASFLYQYDNGTNVTIGIATNYSFVQPLWFNTTWDTTSVIDGQDYKIWVNVSTLSGNYSASFPTCPAPFAETSSYESIFLHYSSKTSFFEPVISLSHQ